VANRGARSDINATIFFLGFNGDRRLFFEIESYDPVAGEIFMWVSVATVSHTVDTVFYMYFGNASITTSQEFVTGVWIATSNLSCMGTTTLPSTLVN